MNGAVTNEALAGLLGLSIGVTIAIVSIVSIALYILGVIAYWNMFKKFGEPGWKAIIPFYNLYIVYKYTWKISMFWIVIGLAVLVGILSSAGLGLFGALVMLVAAIALLVLEIISYYKLSLSFGHGAGYTIGLIFLNFIFILILGLGSSEYVGKIE